MAKAKYKTLTRIWHTADARHYEKGVMVHLDHLDAAEIACLIVGGVVGDARSRPKLAVEALGVDMASALKLWRRRIETPADVAAKTPGFLAGVSGAPVSECEKWQAKASKTKPEVMNG